jgi:dihydroflavonol-4-reductase
LKALVTGGTGFVGSHVVRALHAAGHSARVLHRPASKLDGLADVPFESAIGDILDSAALRAACAGCEVVYHVAAVADYWRADKNKMFEANVGGTQSVLAAAKAAGVRRVVFTSSAAVIGARPDRSPATEADDFNLPPAHFPYGYSKVLAERVVGEAVAAGQDVVIVNPVVILGPGDLNRISGDFVIKIKQLGWAVPVPPGGVAVTDVRDVARWHLAAAERGRTGERYLLTTENYPYHRWFALIADTVGATRPSFPLPASAIPVMASLIELGRRLGIPLPVDANQTRLGGRHLYFDGRKTWTALGEPTIAMPQSVADTYAWYHEKGYV